MFLAASQAKAACLCCSRSFPGLGQPRGSLPPAIRAVLSTQCNSVTAGMAQPMGKGSAPSQQRGKELGISSARTENNNKKEEMLSAVPAKIGLLPGLWVFYMNTGNSQRYLWRKKLVSYLRTCDTAPLMGQPVCLSLIYAADLGDDKYC